MERIASFIGYVVVGILFLGSMILRMSKNGKRAYIGTELLLVACLYYLFL